MILAPQSTDGFYFVGVGNSFFFWRSTRELPCQPKTELVVAWKDEI